MVCSRKKVVYIQIEILDQNSNRTSFMLKVKLLSKSVCGGTTRSIWGKYPNALSKTSESVFLKFVSLTFHLIRQCFSIYQYSSKAIMLHLKHL